MPVYHIVSFASKSPQGLESIIKNAKSLQTGCVKPNGETYIRDVKCGKQISTEDHHHGMEIVFVMEFDSNEDLQYYLWEDPYHTRFKTQQGPENISSVVCLDFEDQKF